MSHDLFSRLILTNMLLLLVLAGAGLQTIGKPKIQRVIKALMTIFVSSAFVILLLGIWGLL